MQSGLKVAPKVLLAAGLLSISFSAVADICCLDLSFCPYVGIDLQRRHVRWKDGFGDNLFKHDYPQGNVFVGARLHDYFGLEVGYEDSVTKTRLSSIGSGNVLGVAVTNPPELFLSKAQFKGLNASMVAYLPIREFCVDLFGSVGITRLRTYHKVIFLADSEDFFDFRTNGSTFRSTKSILALSLGLQYIICNTYGIRIKGTWEETARIKQNTSLERPSASAILRLKNSYNYGLGFFILF